MPQFILAFPLTKEINEPLALTETVTLAADATSAIIPGCSVMFKVVRKEHVDGLADIFKEHQDIPAETAAAIEAHKSLLFLLGEVKNVEEVTQVNMTVLKVFNAGALGVYMQQCGAAWTDGRHRLKSPSDGFPANQACPALDGSVPLASCPESRAWARRSLQPRHSTCLRGHWCLHPGSRWSVRGRPARSGFVRSFHDRWPLGTDTSSAAHS